MFGRLRLHSGAFGIAILALFALVSFGCKAGGTLVPCQGNCVAGVGWIKFSEDIGSINAWSIYETREVDPNVYTHDSNSQPTGTVTVTLANGSTVNYTGNLSLDTSTQPAPTTPGHNVLVYRPSDPAGLQAFIDQYRDQAVSTDISSTVQLRDISGGSVQTTTVDFKANYNSNLGYMGSVTGTPPSYSGGVFNKDV